MRNKIAKCVRCGESDYTEYMARIDSRLLCQVCYDEEMDASEDAIIREVFNQANFDLDGNRRSER